MSRVKRTILFDEQAKIWHGPDPVEPPYHNDYAIGRFLFSKMKINGKAIALHSDIDKCSVTYEELLIDSIRIAEHLNKLAPNQDDIVGIVSGNTTYATHIFCASWFNATAIHPINPVHEQAVVEHIFGKTRPKIIFCEGKYYQKVLKSCQQLHLQIPIYTINDHIEGVCSLLDLIKPTGTEKFYEPKELMHGGDQTIFILNSSGSTGLPKAVCKSNNSYIFQPIATSKDDVILFFSPLDWVSAPVLTIDAIKSCAKRIVTTAPYTPECMVELLERYKITITIFCPSYLASLVYTPNIKQSLSSLRLVLCGGANLPVPVYQKFRNLLRPEQEFLVTYGISEFAGLSFNSNSEKPNSVGRISAGARAKIIEADGRQLSVGEIGEVLLYDGATWNGYFNDPVATLEMFDNEMWFHTGDLGYFDQDGDLFIVDRKKDVMKYRGIHYTPQEIEQVIAQLPNVVEVCVFGNTNELEGDRPAAAIVRQKDSSLTEDEVIQYVAKQFEVEWKRLHGGVIFMNSLPKTGSGKVIRKDTKMLALQQKEKISYSR